MLPSSRHKPKSPATNCILSHGLVSMFGFIVLLTLFFFSLFGAGAAEFQVVTNDGFVLVEIPAGTFTMGTTEEQRDALIEQKVWTRFENCELPAHVVTISKPFFVGKNEVTQKQWEGVMEKNPSAFKGEDLPVESVSWEAVQEFLKKVNEKSGSKYRLPTEAEWEYCCRSGGTNFFGLGTNHLPVSRDKLGEYAWYRANSENQTHAVGEKKSNAWGLHDMHGNVWEWCQDWYRADYYSRAPAKDPINDTSSPERVFRGGSWFLEWRNLRAAFRSGNIPSFKSQYVGFRLVKEIEDQKVISP